MLSLTVHAFVTFSLGVTDPIDKGRRNSYFLINSDPSIVNCTEPKLEISSYSPGLVHRLFGVQLYGYPYVWLKTTTHYLTIRSQQK